MFNDKLILPSPPKSSSFSIALLSPFFTFDEDLYQTNEKRSVGSGAWLETAQIIVSWFCGGPPCKWTSLSSFLIRRVSFSWLIMSSISLEAERLFFVNDVVTFFVIFLDTFDTPLIVFEAIDLLILKLDLLLP